MDSLHDIPSVDEDDGNLSIPNFKNKDFKKAGLKVLGNKRRLLSDSSSIAFIINLVLPGVGTILLDHWGKGFLQTILTLIAIFGMLSGSPFLFYLGIGVYVPVWIWAFAGSFGGEYHSIKKF